MVVSSEGYGCEFTKLKSKLKYWAYVYKSHMSFVKHMRVSNACNMDFCLFIVLGDKFSLLTRCDFTRLPHFSWLFTVYHRNMGGKELERSGVILPVMLFLPSSTKYVR